MSEGVRGDRGRGSPHLPTRPATRLLVVVLAVAVATLAGWSLMDGRPFATTALVTIEKRGSAERTHALVRRAIDALGRDAGGPGTRDAHGAIHIAVAPDDEQVIVIEFRGPSAAAARALARTALPRAVRSTQTRLGDDARVMVAEGPGSARPVGSAALLIAGAVGLGIVTALVTLIPSWIRQGRTLA